MKLKAGGSAPTPPSLQSQMESAFDPSDVDGAMQLAYLALRLCEAVSLALYSENHNMLMGRDIAGRLNVGLLDVAKQIGLLSGHATGKKVALLHARLRGFAEPPAPSTPEEK